MTADQLAKTLLRPVATRQQRFRLSLKLACCWAGTALAALIVLAIERQSGWAFSPAALLLGIMALGVALLFLVQHIRAEPDWRRLACQIEARYPQLDGRLLTALQQSPNEGHELNYLQQRVLQETLRYRQQSDWADVVPKSRMTLAQTAHWTALICCAFVLCSLPQPGKAGLIARISNLSVTVTPGDTSLERGSGLVVLARFSGPLPSAVELVASPSGNQSDDPLLPANQADAPNTRTPTNSSVTRTLRIPLVKSLADPVFGGSIPDVSSNLLYHIEYTGQRTRDFKVSVFEYPRLERADVELTFPDYTGQPPKRIENTRRLSAVEGSRVDLSLQLNKPVVSARLVAKDNDHTVLPLVLRTNGSIAALEDFTLHASKTYELQLMDADGRTNKTPDHFVFDAFTNRAPELKLASPRGDLRPSALEEIPFEGTVWDDFGVKSFGLAYTAPGQETKFIELGGDVPAKEKRSFQYLLRLEDLGIQPDQLMAWFLWADDLGPDGKLRRTSGDLFFAEVRPFDEVFREGDDSAGAGGAGQDGQSSKLIELQKQIITATWNLQRRHGSPIAPDSKVPAGEDPKSSKRSSQKTSPSGQSGVSSFPFRFGLVPASSQAMPPMPSGFHVHPGGMLDNSPKLKHWAVAAPSGKMIAAPGPHEGLFSLSLRERSGMRGTRASNVRSFSLRNTPLLFGQVAPSNGSDSKLAATNTALPRIRTKSGNYSEDALVVRDSQAQALEQAEANAGQQRDPRGQALWSSAIKAMEAALARLDHATNSPAGLQEALPAEQAAYEALLKLQQHEYQVMRSRNRNQQGNGSMQDRMQRQLEQMDMTQAENRYETQRQAQKPKDNQLREQLQVMNRLQELARRQQDLNDRLKELQTALQQARTEQEREEIRRRLKRLQEEEQEMLADVDELRQRMDRPENQSRMADERKQLDQTREDVQRAAQASSQGDPSQALAAGTRAQRQLQQLRDQMRKENSNHFADDLRQMRADARDLSRRQEDLSKKLESDNADGKGPKPLTDAPAREQMMKQLAEQKQRMTNLVEHATQVSKQGEDAEPLLSRELYDTLRKFSQDSLQNVRETQEELVSRRLMSENLSEQLKQSSEHDGAKLLDVASEMLRHDFRRQAADTIQRARGPIDDFKNGVERAAGSVLGDDTEALRLAQQELDQLTEQLQREIAQAETNSLSTNGAGSPDAPGKTELAKNDSKARNQSPLSRTEKAQSQNSQEGATSQQQGQPQPSGQESASAASGQQQGQNGQNPDAGNQPGSQTQKSEQAGAGARNQPNDTSGQIADRGPLTQGGVANAGGAGGNFLQNFDRVWNDAGPWRGGPLTGANFGPWSDRLRDVEEVLEFPDLRNEVATSRERARLIRQDFKRDRKKPDWAVVRLQVMGPLLEVRARIADELARRESNDALAPIDRDPVPSRYSSLVRRYYEELGKDKPPPAQK